MIPPVVHGQAVRSEIILVGQAPGDKEGIMGKPFAWTAGKTLFKWFSQIGLPEEKFRTKIYMSAVCRCFPGKNPKGGDRVPDVYEIANCSVWMKKEITILKPNLIIPVGKLAIQEFIEAKQLNSVIGQSFSVTKYKHTFDLIPLPHPSGASTWHRTEPGISLLQSALSLISKHESFREL